MNPFSLSSCRNRKDCTKRIIISRGVPGGRSLSLSLSLCHALSRRKKERKYLNLDLVPALSHFIREFCFILYLFYYYFFSLLNRLGVVLPACRDTAGIRHPETSEFIDSVSVASVALAIINWLALGWRLHFDIGYSNCCLSPSPILWSATLCVSGFYSKSRVTVSLEPQSITIGPLAVVSAHGYHYYVDFDIT